jgi:hypothetical protein
VWTHRWALFYNAAYPISEHAKCKSHSPEGGGGGGAYVVTYRVRREGGT